MEISYVLKLSHNREPSLIRSHIKGFLSQEGLMRMIYFGMCWRSVKDSAFGCKVKKYLPVLVILDLANFQVFLGMFFF